MYEDFKKLYDDIIYRIKLIFKVLFVYTPKNLIGTFKSLFIEKETENHSSLYNTSKNILIALVVAIMIRSFLYEPFHIPSGSMKPNLLEGDYIFVSKYEFGYSRYSFPFGIKFFSNRKFFKKKPKRGDVVVFRLPTNTSINYIKRLVGIPGDKIQMKNGILYINDREIDKIFIKNILEYEDNENTQVKMYEEKIDNLYYNVLDRTIYSDGDNTELFEIPNNYYFFMGDNRDNSLDSRFPQTGLVPEENIVGKAKIIFLSSKENPLKFWKWKKIIRWNRFFKLIK